MTVVVHIVAGHLTESLNDQRMLRPVDRRSSTAPRQRGQETTSKPAELSVDVPPGLQQLLGNTTLLSYVIAYKSKNFGQIFALTYA